MQFCDHEKNLESLELSKPGLATTLNLKPKHTDPKDFPLTKASSYFVHEDDFKYYIATTKPYPNEVGS